MQIKQRALKGLTNVNYGDQVAVLHLDSRSFQRVHSVEALEERKLLSSKRKCISQIEY